MKPVMPLRPIKISDKVKEAAYRNLASGAIRKFGDAVVAIADRILHPSRKSDEKLALDWQRGEEASEDGRLAAAEAIDFLPPGRRMFPALPIAGQVLQGIEAELPGTPLWKLWTRFLRRACDRDRVGEAHSMPWSERDARIWQTVVPRMAGWLPDDEADQMRLSFARGFDRLMAA